MKHQQTTSPYQRRQLNAPYASRALVVDAYDARLLLKHGQAKLERSYATLTRGPIFIADAAKRRIVAAASLERVWQSGDHYVWEVTQATPLSQSVDVVQAMQFDWLTLPIEVASFAAVSASCYKSLLPASSQAAERESVTKYLIPRSLTGEVFLPDASVDGWYVYGSEQSPKRTNDYRTALVQISQMQLGWYVKTPVGGRWLTYAMGYELTEERIIVASLTEKS